MKQLYLLLFLSPIFICSGTNSPGNELSSSINMINSNSIRFIDKDTCHIEGFAFVLWDYRSTKVLRAYIKNSQIYVVNDGLQFARFRIIQYVFSSLTDEYMPSFRWYNQRISPPILQILKNSRIGDQFLFEEIVVVDQNKNILTNEVRPFVIERVSL